ncbi:DUF1302 domain-containing protein [Solimonas sp. C16B3]|uniref:DUF1302 domain-containing protein n=2 Tax=Solimonas marina TaxID=2714601 RepID=A0A970B5M2_9GAMM|nr:DUF1302 domain-containing protein [Solimonas marina]
MTAAPASALHFDAGTFGGETIEGTLDSILTAGAAMRTQSPSSKLIGKGNLQPDVCAGVYQGCQGLFRDQTQPARRLGEVPGAPGMNGDDGDLNYRRGDLFQAPIKLDSALTLTWGEFGFFGRIIGYYDAVNADFTERHPDRISANNADAVARYGTFLPVPLLQNTIGALPPALQQFVGALPVVGGRYYSGGALVKNRRRDGEVLRQVGSNVEAMESYVFGNVDVGGHELTFKLGRQIVNWGESTLLALNSVNQANPVDANRVYRVGTLTEEAFTPVAMAYLSVPATADLTLEGYYALEWRHLQAPAPGSYFSTQDIGTSNTGDTLNLSFGGSAEDPGCLSKLLDNPLSQITPTCVTVSRLPDMRARNSGQFGLSLQYYAENLNGGTQFAFYYQHYHSQLPYLGFFASYPSCARAGGNSRHNDATDLLSFLADCPNLPILASDPTAATSDAVPFDSARFALQYPEDIELFGFSFNTTFGNYALQGEVAYRPNKPMQVDAHDLAFAAFGPTLTHCNSAAAGCAGSVAGIGYPEDNAPLGLYGSSDFIAADGQRAYNDTVDLVIGHVPGSARSFPNYVIPYRGGVAGENTACYPQPGSADDAAHGFDGFTHPYYAYNRHSPCYIRGYERFHDLNVDLGATRVYSATENWIAADQLIVLYELGAEWVPDLPSYDRLVLQGPAADVYGPTAGADGSGADGSQRACGGASNCSIGPDGLRFNPHQQSSDGFPTAFSWGYRVIAQASYESVLPRISLKPTLIWRHDVGGISPGPAGNFVRNRKEVDSLLEIRYDAALSLNVGYTWFFGGGAYNTLRDRDFAQSFIKYQF